MHKNQLERKFFTSVKIFSFNINQDNSFQVNLDQIILTIKIKKEMDSRQSSISKRGSEDDENISI